MNTKAMEEWKPQLEQEALRFLTKLMRTPEQFSDHIKHTAGATVVRPTYGYQPKDEHDQLIEAAQRNMESFSKATTPGAFAVDVFPILKYNPWAGFHRTVVVWREEIRVVADGDMEFVWDQMASTVVFDF